MATYGTTVRRGLPRVAGGEPWPPAGLAEPAAPVAEPPVVERAQRDETPVPSVAEPVEASPVAVVSASSDPSASSGTESEVSGTVIRSIRRGLPRVPGGEPWPPADAAPTGVPVIASAVAEPVEASSRPVVERRFDSPALAQRGSSRDETASTGFGAAPSSRSARSGTVAVRRGLPRVPGGEPWPPAGFAPAPAPRIAAPVAEPVEASTVPIAEAAFDPSTSSGTELGSSGTELPSSGPERGAAPGTVVATRTAPGELTPLPFTQTVFPGKAAVVFEQERLSGTQHRTPEPARIGPFTRVQWAGAVVVAGGGLLYAAAMAVVAVRWLLSLEPMQEFLLAYPGEYPLPVGAPVGIPPWLGWQHFFNTFLIVLIIRTGLQVRTEKRPTAFWSPRTNPKRKISLNLWLHQSLDILWIVNGVLYVILLFSTGQWMKIVPTSWEVFPNALSAGLQYVSLDWPTENGWVNYNSLQQLAYFATVFLAAPLAIATGVRMSGIWPKNATTLSKAYPVEWARAIHFPVMLYFVAFIIVHVALVFATNALRNLNHMYASQDAVNWTGFFIFAASLIVIAAGWIAARPLVLAPIARLFGKVSGR